MRRKTDNEFILDAKAVHGDTYDYSFVNYIKSQAKVKLVCKSHGVFFQSPAKHVSGQGCPICANESRNDNRKLSTEQFIDKANKVHSNKYDYSIAKYANSHEKVIIICPIHGEFSQEARSHINGCGCPECKRETLYNLKVDSLVDVLRKFAGAHDDKYDYRNVKYTNALTKVEILCKTHGSFYQTPANHIKGVGCPSCTRYGFDKSACGFVYILRSNDLRRMKVGISNNAEQRISWLRGATPFEFYVIKTRKFDIGEQAIKCESDLHKTFYSAGLSGFNGCTEWFRYDESVVNMLVNWNENKQSVKIL